ncbi:DUF86 domain-containing protein [Maribrevibacterium harenarium]|uniref:DUF86 domain-containing protein n=1 Tax=Maribrevibacterium harenarium TaxID=2589817 RepID=A0A501WPV2_9GAMM|nr:DUF86 domain-containing protein [Maribrevibacterium harenarium]TPE51813.1 DUF86 domain-containing protein [Maribrevibacterium harenarium]
MADIHYLASIKLNAEIYQKELDQLRAILEQRNFSTFEYRACERSLQVSIEAAIGVAKHWAKSVAGFSPSDAYQAFEVLAQHQHLSLEKLASWRKVIGLRNALVHDYLNIDPEIVRSVINHGYYQQVFDFIELGTEALQQNLS